MNASDPTPAPHPWSKDALFAKAQRYAEEMESYSEDDWQYGLWSTFVLEFLARAALAHVSPVLLADQKEWNNLYYALGFEPKATKFVPKSADIATVLARLREILPNFTPELESFSVRQMSRRNEELHAGSAPFDKLGTSAWLATFYETSDALLTSMNETLAVLVGDEQATVAADMIVAAKDQAAKSIGKTVAAHKTIWEGKDKAEREDLATQAAAWATRNNGHRVKCPACDSTALVIGSPVAAPKKSLDGDLIVEKQTYLPSKFECMACGLKIAGYSHLNACGLGDSYTATFEYDAIEYYAPPPDPDDFYEPDFNEP
jgi:hypothetical protein